jgi:hypothetical protein
MKIKEKHNKTSEFDKRVHHYTGKNKNKLKK